MPEERGGMSVAKGERAEKNGDMTNMIAGIFTVQFQRIYRWSSWGNWKNA